MKPLLVKYMMMVDKVKSRNRKRFRLLTDPGLVKPEMSPWKQFHRRHVDA